MAASLFATTATMLSKINQSKELAIEVANLTEKVEEMTNEIGTAKTEAKLASKEPDELRAKLAELSNDIAAFAVQAKSCDDIKKKYQLKQ